MFRYLPLVDYPNHLARAFILAHLDDPALARFYAADWAPNPYLLMDATLVALQAIVPVEVAGRILLSASLLTLPLAVWYFLRQANPGQDYAALWSLLFSYNYFFFTGLVNLQLSAALCFLVLGVWLRYRARPQRPLWLLLLVLVTLLYFTHLVGFMVAGLAMAIFLLGERRSLVELLASAFLFLPGLVLFAWSRWLAEASPAVLYLGWKFKSSNPLLVLLGFSPVLDFLTCCAIAACILATWWKNPEFRLNRRWLGVCVTLYALYWVLPYGYGSAKDVDARLWLFICLAALAAACAGRRARLLAPVALLLFVVRSADMAWQVHALQPRLAALANSVAAIPSSARVLPLVEERSAGQLREKATRHLWAYGVIRKGWFSPYVFHDPGVHPLRLVQHAYALQSGLLVPPAYEEEPDWEQVRRDYDYVWALGGPRFREQLKALGPLVFAADELAVHRVDRDATGP
ncbi:MAG: hypothetical protein L0099_02405 [Acidobacteria bacterium]|nr:hypothetical protein [Acidobacteriota bacterium]